eukprot:gene22415-28538_t
MSSTGIAVGIKRGFPVEKRAKVARPSHAKAKRLLDMLKTGGASSEKRMYKYAKRRLGTHRRALKKRDQVKEVYGKIRARAGN